VGQGTIAQRQRGARMRTISHRGISRVEAAKNHRPRTRRRQRLRHDHQSGRLLRHRPHPYTLPLMYRHPQVFILAVISRVISHMNQEMRQAWACRRSS